LSRKEELENIFRCLDKDKKTIITKLIDEVVFLEEEMEKLRKLPFIRIDSCNKAKQKLTPAAKLYKEHTQSYMNAIRILCSLTGTTEQEKESPLRAYLKQLQEKYE
jgi:hypothetical protein